MRFSFGEIIVRVQRDFSEFEAERKTGHNDVRDEVRDYVIRDV